MRDRLLPYDPDIEEQRLQDERAAIKNGIAEVILAWSKVETWLLILFSEITGEGGEYPVTEAIYFTPAALEIRTKLVDNAFCAYIENEQRRGDQTQSGLTEAISVEILSEWASVLNLLGRLRKTRNKVAHGQTQLFALDPEGEKLVMRLSSVQDQPFVNGQPPGMASNDLIVSAAAVESAADLIGFFWKIVGRLRDPGIWQPLPDTLSELKAKRAGQRAA